MALVMRGDPDAAAPAVGVQPQAVDVPLPGGAPAPLADDLGLDEELVAELRGGRRGAHAILPSVSRSTGKAR